MDTMEQHRGVVVWLTGLSGAGKTTLAVALERRLLQTSCPVTRLDGDDLRQGLCADLGYGRGDRSENVRRVAEVAVLMARAGLVCVVAVIAPYAADRARAKSLAAAHAVKFLEVFVDAPIQVCEGRDPKGLYSLARSGKLSGLTGIADAYEPPESPDVHVRTDVFAPDECEAHLLAAVVSAVSAPGARA